jgi:hypothetical protein
MLQSVLQLLHLNNFKVKGATVNDEALKLFSLHIFNAVVIGGGVDDESRLYFQTTFSSLNPAIKIIDAHPKTILKDLEKAFA